MGPGVKCRYNAVFPQGRTAFFNEKIGTANNGSSFVGLYSKVPIWAK